MAAGKVSNDARIRRLAHMAGKRVGFVGLGEMGKPMAVNLVKRGFEVAVIGHVRPEPVEELRDLGAGVAASLRQLAAASDFVFTCVKDHRQTQEVVFGQDGLWEGLKAGSALIVASTLEPAFMRELWRKGKERRVAVLDAPISGGARGAQEGTLTIMVGGDEEDFESCRPVLEAVGKDISYMGPSGCGMVAKVVNNAVMAVTLSAVIECLTFGAKAGVKRERLVEVLRTGTGRSQVVENLAKYEYRLKSGRSFIGKDLGILLDFSREIGAKLPTVGLVSQLDLPDKWAKMESVSG
ncbi:MAG: NAD(P)-dependent oxidoreductase [Chloroflexota bacterium]